MRVARNSSVPSRIFCLELFLATVGAVGELQAVMLLAAAPMGSAHVETEGARLS